MGVYLQINIFFLVKYIQFFLNHIPGLSFLVPETSWVFTEKDAAENQPLQAKL